MEGNLGLYEVIPHHLHSVLGFPEHSTGNPWKKTQVVFYTGGSIEGGFSFGEILVTWVSLGFRD